MKNKILLTFVSIAAIVFFILYMLDLTHARMRIVKKSINNKEITIERAVTAAEQHQGLSYRNSLANDHAMLFVYRKEQPLFFWMYKMKFPIDIIWLDKNCRIIDISANMQPCEDNRPCPIISARNPSKYVLESVSGYAASNHLSVNQSLSVCN